MSLLPSATEILFGIGAGPDVVGVTHECDFPDAARSLPQLTSSALPTAGASAEIDRHVRASVHSGSSLYFLDSELLERLNPDLIVTQELCAVCAVSYEIVDRAAKRLRGDTRIVSLEPASLDDVLANIRYLGTLTGRESGAGALVEGLQRNIDALRAGTATRQVKPRVLVLEWSDPPMSAGHWIPGLVELAGGIPVLGNPGANSQTLQWPEIAAVDPDVIVIAPCGFDLERTREAARELESNAIYTGLRAYRAGHVYLMDGNAFMSRPGPRLVESAAMIAEYLEQSHGNERRDLDDDDDRADHIAGDAAP